MTTTKPEKFQDAEIHWDLKRLLDDLAEVKGESLTPTEQLTLKGLLCGHTPADLAEVRVKDKRGQQTSVSRGVNKYVKRLMKIKGVEVPEKLNSEQRLAMLKNAGYKKQLVALKDDVTMPIKTLEALIKVNGIGEKQLTFNNPVTVEFNIRVVTSLPAEEIIKMLSGSKVEKEED